MTKPIHTPKNYLAAIHIAFKALGINKEDACALKLQVTGKASAGDMTVQQQKRLLARLHELQSGAPQARTAAHNLDARWYKARALWTALASAGHVRIDTDAALMAWVKRQTRLEHWRFLNGHQMETVIESLKKWCADKGVPTHGQEKQG